jgi:hypothetical protein
VSTLRVSNESDRLDTWDMPDGWQIVNFGQAVSIAEGQVDPRNPVHASLPHVGPENVESATGRLLGSPTAGELGLKSGKYQFQPGDFNLATWSTRRSAPTFENLFSLTSMDCAVRTCIR